jgi:hypothetical protein
MPRVLYLLLLALPSAAQLQRPFGPAAPAAGKGVIEGTVVDSVTHEPIKKAQVNLAGPLPNPPMAVTDAGGGFAFRSLPPGAYWVSASKPGYNLPQVLFGGNPNVQVTLGTDEEKKGIEVALLPGGSISGRVLDEDDAPLRHCSVSAVRPGYEQGRRNLRSVFGIVTNDKGEYRIANLTPDRYYLFARCHSEVPGPHPLLPRGDPRTPYETYQPRFYGGGLDPSTATRLAVSAGANLEGVDFEMRRVPAYTLRGTVTASDPEAFAGPITVLLLPANRQVQDLLQLGASTDPRDRTFQIRSVVPGSYLLVAFASQEGRSFYAQRRVEIGTAPPDPIEVSLASGAELKGSVQFDSGDHPPLQNAQVFLAPVEPRAFTPQPHAQINKDGTFTLAGIMPGRWRLMIGAAGYVKSLFLAGQQVSPYDFQIAAGSAGPLRVVMGAKMGSVRVTIDGAPPDRLSSVLLYPEDAGRMGIGLERLSAGSDRLEIPSVPPGRYRLLATDTLNPWPLLQRPDLLKAIESSTQAIDVAEGGQVSATVEVVPREQLAKLFQEQE